ncbi:MarR family transcriptional regulator [uncultured Roseovarius sp.]|uniref:MarR family winged helix-turn-helix transcriptional regulator n=1 Tax=uncultured Roseovarius sp. TaxID=293344 RepID=UPI00259673C6|nr:MarR family transcriptional regulator [uncultured Roseovarius sp.]
MGSSDTTSCQTSGCTEQLAEMLVHIGRTARGEETGVGLTAAQWTGLRFFARANRASRTPSAFASFQATTRGTASQTIKALEGKGLVRRQRSETDGRSVRFELTAQGRDMLGQDPLRHLMAALAGLDPCDRAAMERLLPVIAAELARQRGCRAFGTCDDCGHYEKRPCGGYCACAALDLPPGEIGRLCASYAPRCGADETVPQTAGNAGSRE